MPTLRFVNPVNYWIYTLAVYSLCCRSSKVGLPYDITRMEVCDVDLDSSPLPPGAPHDLDIRHFVANGNAGLNVSFYLPDDGSVTYLTGFQIKLLHTEGDSMNLAECYRIELRRSHRSKDIISKQKIIFDHFRNLPGSATYFLQVTSLPVPISGSWKSQEGFYEISRFKGIRTDEPCSWKPSFFSVTSKSNHFGIAFNLAPPEFAFQKYTIEIYECSGSCRGPLQQRRINSTELHIGPDELHKISVGKTDIHFRNIFHSYFLTIRACILKQPEGDCRCSRTFRTSEFRVPGHSVVGDKRALDQQPEIEHVVPSISSGQRDDIIPLETAEHVQEPSRTRLHFGSRGLSTLLLGISAVVCLTTAAAVMFVTKRRNKKHKLTVKTPEKTNPEQSKALIGSTDLPKRTWLVLYSADSGHHEACVEGFSRILQLHGLDVISLKTNEETFNYSNIANFLEISDKIHVLIMHSQGVFQQHFSENRSQPVIKDSLLKFFQDGDSHQHFDKIINIKFDTTPEEFILSSFLQCSKCYAIPRDLSGFIKDFKLYGVDSDVVKDSYSALTSLVYRQGKVTCYENKCDYSSYEHQRQDSGYDSGMASPSTPLTEIPLVNGVNSEMYQREEKDSYRCYNDGFHQPHCASGLESQDSSFANILSDISAPNMNTKIISNVVSHSKIFSTTSDKGQPCNSPPLNSKYSPMKYSPMKHSPRTCSPRKCSQLSLFFSPPNLTSDADNISVYSNEITEAYERLLMINGTV